MWQHIEQSALALSMNFRYTRHRVWEEHTVSYDAKPSRSFSDQHVTVR